MKIADQLKEEINPPFIGLAVLVETVLLGVLLLGGFLFFKNWPRIKDRFSSYKVCGQVLEYGSNVSVPDFRIDLGKEHVYSVHDGSFCWEGLPKGTQLGFELPEQYESDKTVPPDYASYRELSPFMRQVDHSIKLVLGVEAASRRIFDYQKSGTYYPLWNYLTDSSKNTWSNKPHDFTQALSTERNLRSKFDQSHVVAYEILSQQRVGEGEYRFVVSWTRGDGSSYSQIETFVKQDGWWHYEYPRLPKEVYRYIDMVTKKLR